MFVFRGYQSLQFAVSASAGIKGPSEPKPGPVPIGKPPTFAAGGSLAGIKGPSEPKPGPFPIGLPQTLAGDVQELMSRGISGIDRLAVVVYAPSGGVQLRMEIDSKGKSLYKSLSIPLSPQNGMAQIFCLDQGASNEVAKHFVPGNHFKLILEGANAGECSLDVKPYP